MDLILIVSDRPDDYYQKQDEYSRDELTALMSCRTSHRGSIRRKLRQRVLRKREEFEYYPKKSPRKGAK